MNSFVGIAPPSDPVGSILVKILYSVEGRRRGVRVLEPRNKSLVFEIALSLSLTCVYILLMLIAHISLLA